MDALPNETLEKILSYLDLRSLKRALQIFSLPGFDYLLRLKAGKTLLCAWRGRLRRQEETLKRIREGGLYYTSPQGCLTCGKKSRLLHAIHDGSEAELHCFRCFYRGLVACSTRKGGRIVLDSRFKNYRRSALDKVEIPDTLCLPLLLGAASSQRWRLGDFLRIPAEPSRGAERGHDFFGRNTAGGLPNCTAFSFPAGGPEWPPPETEDEW